MPDTFTTTEFRLFKHPDEEPTHDFAEINAKQMLILQRNQLEEFGHPDPRQLADPKNEGHVDNLMHEFHDETVRLVAAYFTPTGRAMRGFVRLDDWHENNEATFSPDQASAWRKANRSAEKDEDGNIVAYQLTKERALGMQAVVSSELEASDQYMTRHAIVTWVLDNVGLFHLPRRQSVASAVLGRDVTLGPVSHLNATSLDNNPIIEPLEYHGFHPQGVPIDAARVPGYEQGFDGRQFTRYQYTVPSSQRH